VVEGQPNIAFSNVYSFILVVLVTTGAIGAILFASFLLELGRREWRSVETSRTDDMRSLSFSAALAFVCIAMYWVGSPAYNMSFLWFAFAFGTALAPQHDQLENKWPASESI
jgi:hypothetical protein